MGRTSRWTANKKEKNIENKKLNTRNFSASILKFAIAIALLVILMAAFVYAGDVIVENGKLDVDSKLYVDGAGNVGVGTLAPNEKLTVIGNTEVQQNNEVFLNLKNTEASGKQYALISAGSSGGIGVGKFSIYDKTAGVSRLTIDSNGNVGIGTTSPTNLLDVYSTGVGPLFRLTYASSGTALSSGVGLQLLNTDTTNNNQNIISFAIRDSAGAELAASRFGGVTISHTNGAVSGALQFQTRNAGTMAERMRITNTGNVGIGTTTPANTLDVQGGLRSIGIGQATGGNSSGLQFRADGVKHVGLRFDGSQLYYEGASASIDPNSWYAAETANFIVRNGSVGIGTVNPGQKLSVVGTIESTSGGFKFPDGTTQTTASSGNGSGQWITNGSSIYYNNGSVGIGTAGPLAKLSVTATGGGELTGQTTNLNAAETFRVGLQAAGDASDTRRSSILLGTTVGTGGSDSYISFETNKYGVSRAERMRITSTGSVGIGTTAPAQKLDVTGQIHSTGDVCTDAGGGKCLSTVNGSGGSQWTTSGSNIYYNTGNVGIGLETPIQEARVDIYNIMLNHTGIDPVLRVRARSKGDNTNFIGTTGGRFLVMDNENVDANTKGVLYGASFEVAPIVARNNVPYDDVDGITVQNVGTAKATDAIYVATSPQISGKAWFSGLTIDADVTRGIQIGGTNDYGLYITASSTKNFIGGSVGIGTTSPARLLDVYSTGVGPLFGLTYADSGTALSSGIGLHLLNTDTTNNNQNIISFAIRDSAGAELAASRFGGVTISHTNGAVSGALQFQTRNAGTMAERMRINSAGNVGVSTQNPTEKLHVIGNILATGTVCGSNIACSSASRFKTNIKTLEGGLGKVEHLRGVSFDWKTNGKHDIGVIAEEVAEVLPEVVIYEENGVDAKTVDYARLTSVLIEAVKEQSSQVKELRKENDELKQRVEILETKK